MDNIIAISTYGSHRVKNPHTGKTVSAYKMGYSSAASAVLLALYSDKARDVSSKQASYHYIQVDGDVVVRHSYILLKITDTELAKAEGLTRKVHRPAVYRWRDGTWLEFPSIHQPEYTPATGYSGPNFNPTGMRIVAAATGEVEAAIEGITVEKSQRSEKDTPWYWIRGDTYPHRDLLKRWGCRWSKRKKAWYYVGRELPTAVEHLVQQHHTAASAETPVKPAPVEDEPCTIEEAADILGASVKQNPDTPPEPGRLFDLGETVYARYELETPDGKFIPSGTRGTITRLYKRNVRHGWNYDVAFEGIGEGWYFERELTSLESTPGICVTHGAVVPPGVTLPPTDADIKRALIEAGQEPEVLAAKTTPVEPEVVSVIDETPEPEEKSRVRIVKPQSQAGDGVEPDAVQRAIQQTRTRPVSCTTPIGVSSGKKSLIAIPQQPIGELTGSITGNVWCYGFAVHESTAIYINLGGPRTAVEAIRARLSKGEIVNCVPWDSPAIELTAGEGNTGMYTAFMQNIPEAKFTSLILAHELAVNPNYAGKSTTFIFRLSDEQAAIQLKHHVTELVKVPVFDTWADYLYQAGQAAMLVRRTRCAGGLDILVVDLDIDDWTRLLTGGLKERIIELPGMDQFSKDDGSKF